MSEKKGKQAGRKCPFPDCGIMVVAPEERFVWHMEWHEAEEKRIKAGKSEQITPGKFQ